MKLLFIILLTSAVSTGATTLTHANDNCVRSPKDSKSAVVIEFTKRAPPQVAPPLQRGAGRVPVLGPCSTPGNQVENQKIDKESAETDEAGAAS